MLERRFPRFSFGQKEKETLYCAIKLAFDVKEICCQNLLVHFGVPLLLTYAENTVYSIL